MKSLSHLISRAVLTAFCFSLLPLAGCTFVWKADAPAPVAVEDSTTAPAIEQEVAKTSWVELLWQVPENKQAEKIDKYHIYYGDKPGNLSNHEEIAESDLEVIYHPKFGKVYQYRINNVPANSPVYISLQAENKAGISQPTPTIRMEPGQSAPIQ